MTLSPSFKPKMVQNNIVYRRNLKWMINGHTSTRATLDRNINADIPVC